MRFNINGTDDKQRKQASSLPGEICLLLAGVQRGEARHTRDAHRRGEIRANRGYRHSWLPLQRGNPGGVGRATPERAGGEKGERCLAHIRAQHTQGVTCNRDRLRAYIHRTCPGVRGSVMRRYNVCKSARK